MKMDELSELLTQLKQSKEALIPFDPLYLIFAEEVLNQVKRIKEATKIRDLKDKVISSRFVVVSVNGRGVLDELLLVSTSNNYEIELITNDIGVNDFRRSFAEIQEIADYLDGVAAIQSNGYYIFHVNGIKFNNLMFSIIPNGTITFNRIYAKWDVEE